MHADDKGMLHQIVEIFEENRYLSLDRGFLDVSSHGNSIGKVPLDDIAVLLLSAQSVSMSKYLLGELAERNCLVVLCGKNYAPVALQIPITGNFQQASVIKSQIEASIPLKKNIWKSVVISKIENQAKVLQNIGKTQGTKILDLISKSVLSGDSNNREAYAARMYWKQLFGETFTRDKNLEGINAMLNYGYAIVRSSMVRAICCSGLIPSLGIHHDNSLNPACLADDLFEPFRPLVDLIVYSLKQEGFEKVCPETKKRLTNVLWIKVKTSEGFSPLFQAQQYYALSFVKCIKSKKPNIQIPQWEGNLENLSRTEQVRNDVDNGFV